MVTLGAVESSTYVKAGLEQADSLPAASVAVAEKRLVESSATLTLRPVEAKSACEPAATAVVHVASVKIVTVEPASAVPISSGRLSLAGELGELESIVGAVGGVVS